MSGNSSVGTSAVYEAGDQRNYKDSEKPENQATPYEEGKPNSHKDNDSSKSLLSLFSGFLGLSALACFTLSGFVL